MFETFFQLGWHHLTERGAWDHQLFLTSLALAYAPTEWRKWILLATIFAIGHSASIVLLALGLVPLGMPWVEPMIAASILILALIDLAFLHFDPYGLKSAGYKLPAIGLMVLIFGLIHGLGFGSAFIAVLGPGESGGQLAGMIASFTLGVEAGQLVILAILWVLGMLLFEVWQYKPLLLRKLALVAVALAALQILWAG